MSISAIALCSKGLLKIGTNSISSFEDGTTESEVAQSLYPGVRDAFLSSYPWNFATAEISLSQLVGEPVAGFSYAYQLPADFLRALSAGDALQSRGMNYRILEKRLHSNDQKVILRYIFRPRPENFPPWFSQLIITQLASEFAIPIADSVSKMEAYAKSADKLFQSAKLIDSQETPAEIIESNTLTSVRF